VKPIIDYEMSQVVIEMSTAVVDMGHFYWSCREKGQCTVCSGMGDNHTAVSIGTHGKVRLCPSIVSAFVLSDYIHSATCPDWFCSISYAEIPEDGRSHQKRAPGCRLSSCLVYGGRAGHGAWCKMVSVGPSYLS